MFGSNYSGDLTLCLLSILPEVFIPAFKSDNSSIETTELLTNDTHDSDTRTITHDTRTITHDTRTITNLLDLHDTRRKTIKHATERFYTIKHAKSK